MAICPFATQRLLPENRTQPISGGQRIFIAHSIVGSAEGAYGYFLRSTNLESHFILRKNGEIIQLIDTARTADANYQANTFAISVETEDNGDPDNDLWTPAQLYSLVRLGVWARSAHPDIANIPANAWNGTGYGYHSQYREWSLYRKTCPGVVRVKQWKDFVLPEIIKANAKPAPIVPIIKPGEPPIVTTTNELPGNPAIIWYSKTNPITKAVKNHAYIVRSSGLAKHLTPAALNILRAGQIPESTTVYGPDWQRNMVIVDGPCKNV